MGGSYPTNLRVMQVDMSDDVGLIRIQLLLFQAIHSETLGGKRILIAQLREINRVATHHLCPIPTKYYLVSVKLCQLNRI